MKKVAKQNDNCSCLNCKMERARQDLNYHLSQVQLQLKDVAYSIFNHDEYFDDPTDIPF